MKTETPFGALLTCFFLVLFISCTLLAQTARGVEPTEGSGESTHEARSNSGFEAGYEDGFYFRSQDGRHEIVLEGLFQVGLNLNQCNRGRGTEFDVRRMRPELAGRFAGIFCFRIEPKFQDHGVELEEGWFGLDLARGNARLMIGRMKAPFNLEEVRSRRYINFPRFSILNQFAPAEDHGLFLNGRAADSIIEYGIAVYNGTGSSDTNSSRDVAARFAVHPFAGDHASAFENLQFGVAATWGRQDEDVSGGSIVNAFDRDVIDFATSTRLDGERLRAGFELSWFWKSFLVQSEFIWVRQRMSRYGVPDRIDFYGAYIDGSWVLSGEERQGFSGVQPKSPVDVMNLTGRGALVLALRLSELVSDKDLLDKYFTDPERFTEHIRSVSLGLNWFLNEHILIRHTYIHSFYSHHLLLGDCLEDNEGSLMIEWQMHF